VNNANAAARKTWKNHIFDGLEAGMTLSVFSVAKPHGKHMFIVAGVPSATRVRVIELTTANIARILAGKTPKRSIVTRADFLSDTFHLLDVPSVKQNTRQ